MRINEAYAARTTLLNYTHIPRKIIVHQRRRLCSHSSGWPTKLTAMLILYLTATLTDYQLDCCCLAAANTQRRRYYDDDDDDDDDRKSNNAVSVHQLLHTFHVRACVCILYFYIMYGSTLMMMTVFTVTWLFHHHHHYRETIIIFKLPERADQCAPYNYSVFANITTLHSVGPILPGARTRPLTNKAKDRSCPLRCCALLLEVLLKLQSSSQYSCCCWFVGCYLK